MYSDIEAAPASMQEVNLDTFEETPGNQSDLEQFLNGKDALTPELLLPMSLGGDLNFAVLEERGFHCLRKIAFLKQGSVSRIAGLPKELVVLECANQALVEQPAELPKYLEELVLSGNKLRQLNLSGLDRLKRVNVSDNELVRLEGIPPDLETLICSGNRLERLDLARAVHLRTLHVSDNAAPLTIVGLPGGLQDFKNENTQMSQQQPQEAGPGRARRGSKQVPYETALNEYMLLKSADQKNIAKVKQSADQKRGAAVRVCAACKRPGKTLFIETKDRWTARCGVVQNPCGLYIELYRGEMKNAFTVRDECRADLKSIKDDIILLKLDTLFSNLGDKEAATKFTGLLAEHALATAQNERVDAFFSQDDRLAEIQKTSKEIAALEDVIRQGLKEYQVSKNPETLRSLMELQNRDYGALVAKMQGLRHSHYGTAISGEDGEEKTRLHMFEPGLFIEDYSLGEAPSVVRYTTV